jgi:hypothetical protein
VERFALSPHANHRRVPSRTVDTVMQRIVFEPGGQSGWHSHPGPAIVLVTRGELTLYDGDDQSCVGETFAVGQAFVDSGQGHIHLARNQTSAETEVWVTYLDVPPGGAFRADAADPGFCQFLTWRVRGTSRDRSTTGACQREVFLHEDPSHRCGSVVACLSPLPGGAAGFLHVGWRSWAMQLSQDDARDQEPRDDEEHVDADESARKVLRESIKISVAPMMNWSD